MRTFLKPSLSSELRPQDQVYPLLTIGREATSNCSRTASSAFCFVAGRKSPAGHDRLSQRVRRRRWRSQRRLAAEGQFQDDAVEVLGEMVAAKLLEQGAADLIAESRIG